MELWIRSQDRKILKKIDSLYVATYSEDAGYGIYDISSDDIDDCDIPLGFYKTKERALEILDEIQDILKPKQIIKFKNKEMLDSEKFKNNLCVLEPYDTYTNTEIQELTTYIYEMPKE